jgi:hypothetical protein
MKKLISLIIVYMLSTAISSLAQQYVRHIEIIRRNVFDVQLEHSDHFYYRLANKLHVITKDNVIRREVLFADGDVFDEEKLIETLRNLRSLLFIGEALAEVVDVGKDSVDVIITTDDLWTTVAGISIEGGGGFYNVTLYADERNVAGQGISFESQVTFASDDNNGFLVGVYDPRLFGTHNSLNLTYNDYKFQNQLGGTLARPFYSLDTRYSYTIGFNRDRLIPRLYYQGNEVFRYKKDYDYFGGSFGRVFGKFTRFVPSLQYVYSAYDYGEEPHYPDLYAIIPQDEKFSGPGFGLKLSTQRYRTGVYLDEFGTTEDLTEHATVSASVVWSGPTFGGDYEGASLALHAGFFYSPASFIYTGLSDTYSSYYHGDIKRERIINSVSAITYIKPVEYQLLAIRHITQFAWRQRRDYQLLLGGDNGLRGYPDRYLSGAKLTLTNIEYRIFSPIEILTVGLGAAAFCDIGNVWDDGQALSRRDLKSDVGIGLRLGLTKSSTARMVRIDLARALTEDNWYLSFGTENIFSLAGFQ